MGEGSNKKGGGRGGKKKALRSRVPWGPSLQHLGRGSGTKQRLQVRSAPGVSAEGELRGSSGEAGTHWGCPAPLRPRRALRRRLPSPGLRARTSGGCARGARGRAGDLARVTEGRTRQSGAPGLGRRWSLGKKSQCRSRRGRRGAQGPLLGAHGRLCGAPQTLEEPESVGGKGCLISFSLPTPPPPLLRPCPPSPPPPSPSLRLMWALGRHETWTVAACGASLPAKLVHARELLPASSRYHLQGPGSFPIGRTHPCHGAVAFPHAGTSPDLKADLQAPASIHPLIPVLLPAFEPILNHLSQTGNKYLLVNLISLFFFFFLSLPQWRV